MNKKLLGATSALAILAFAGAASAQDGWYGAVDLGWHSQQDDEWLADRANPSGDQVNWDFDRGDDWAGFLRFGTRFEEHWRFEVEGGYRAGDINDIFGNVAATPPQGLCALGQTGLACDAVGGDFNQWSLMGNFIYDFAPDGQINPYLGIGVGFSQLEADIHGTLSSNAGVGPVAQDIRIDDKDLAFAAQAIAGVSWRVSDQINLDLTYRYFMGANHDLRVDYETVGGLDLGDFEGDYEDHSLTLGVRYSFGYSPPPPPPPVQAPPPPPPPVEAPPPPPPPPIEVREFIVYFPFDQYVLTPEAQSVVQEAASYAASGGAASVIVTGHADTSGSAAYNVRLSERRAKAVADALVSLGVNSSSMSVDWKGESAPAVATGDGVKEPLNRRATINITP